MQTKPQRAQHKYFREQPLKMHCHHCETEKDFTAENFHRDRSYRFGLSTSCRICRRKKKQGYPSYNSGNNIGQKFGLTEAMYDQYVRNGECHICGGKGVGMSLDHCHKSGDARGVLCRACNTGLGCFKDNPLLLEAAISYLRKT